MASYEEIRNANATIKTMDIRGKDYAEVHQRIKAFRMCYPEGFINTQIISHEGGVIVIRAEAGYTIVDGDGSRAKVILGTGTAYEKEGSTNVNRTSYIENCETSAVGRCLAFCGFGIDTSVGSYEEVRDAIHQQEEMDKKKKQKQRATNPESTETVDGFRDPDEELVKEEKKELVKQLAEKAGVDLKELMAEMGIELYVSADRTYKTFKAKDFLRLMRRLNTEE